MTQPAPLPESGPMAAPVDGFNANTDAMFDAGWRIQIIGDLLKNALTKASEGLDASSLFGAAKYLIAVDDLHKVTITQLCAALTTGSGSYYAVESAVYATAQAYDAADRAAAATVKATGG